REFVGAALGTNVLTVMDVLATHPSVPSLKPWEQDRLIVKTLAALNHTYSSPYAAKLDFAVRDEVPREQRDELNAIVASLKENGVPDPVASYLSEEELHGAYAHLEAIGYDRDAIEGALRMPIGGIDYLHFQWSRT